jgi:membrane-associated phospholipid phosphatase
LPAGTIAAKEHPVAEPESLPASGPSARQLVFAAGLLALVTVAALAIDVPVALWAKTHKMPGDLRRIVTLAEVFGWGGTVALIILTAAVLDQRGWRVAPRLALGALGAGIVANGVKLLIARWRPQVANLRGEVWDTFTGWLPVLYHDPSLGEYNFKFQSFPSGHSATAVGLAIALGALYPRGRWLFAVFALLACLQRVSTLAHFPSDILAGAAIGCLVGSLCAPGGPLYLGLADRRLECGDSPH